MHLIMLGCWIERYPKTRVKFRRLPANCDSRSQNDRYAQRSEKSKSAWAKGLLGIAIAGLLAIVLSQITWKPAEVEVAHYSGSPSLSERTNTSVSLAETWADSDWDAEMEAEIADVDTNLVQSDQSDSNQELVLEDEQDDWMTATLIDMAEELDPLPLQSGS